MSIPVIGVPVVSNPYWVTRLLMSIELKNITKAFGLIKEINHFFPFGMIDIVIIIIIIIISSFLFYN